MNIYIWERIDNCTNNYHSEGGVVVVAKNLGRAKELAENEGAVFGEKEDPDNVYKVKTKEERVTLFPDAGCC